MSYDIRKINDDLASLDKNIIRKKNSIIIIMLRHSVNALTCEFYLFNFKYIIYPCNNDQFNDSVSQSFDDFKLFVKNFTL